MGFAISKWQCSFIADEVVSKSQPDAPGLFSPGDKYLSKTGSPEMRMTTVRRHSGWDAGIQPPKPAPAKAGGR